MTESDTVTERRMLADRLAASGDLRSPEWRAAVEGVPRELFLQHGVFLPDEAGYWHPVPTLGADPAEWVALVHTDQSLVTQLDDRLTVDRTTEPLRGIATSSSTMPSLVISMIEALGIEAGHSVLEIGTGSGYSTALLCHRLGEESVTTVEVDPEVAVRADAALEKAGYSTWTVLGDGLLGHPHRAPYDRIIAACAVRRIPHTWIRQTAPGGVILATVGSWSYGTGLARVTVTDRGTAEGRIIGQSCFMHARSQAPRRHFGDLADRTAYADTERPARIAPGVLDGWMPSFLAQLAAPGTEHVTAREADGQETVYLIDIARESFAEITWDGGGWLVRQGGPVSLWDAVETAIAAWQRAGQPPIDAVDLEITATAHTYRIGDDPALRWEHRVV